MYDEIAVECPNCSEVLFLQSKAAGCTLRQYDLDNAPDDVLLDIEGKHYCPKCYYPYEIWTKVITKRIGRAVGA